MGTMTYNVNDTATGILAAKQIKENLFVGLLHKNGKALHEQTQDKDERITYINEQTVYDQTNDHRRL